jgi:HlyD family secretion protein
MPRSVPLYRRPWVWISLAALAGGALFFALRARGPSVPVAVVIQHDLEQHLVASGRVMPPARISVAALSTGLVTWVGPHEGDKVKAQELLVQLDEAEARSQVAQAEAAVAQARARAEQVGSVASVVASLALEQLRATYENAERSFERTRKLVETGALSQQQLDDASRALGVARAQRDSAQAQQIAASAKGVDGRAAAAALALALAQLTTAKLRLEQTRILALQDAIVLTRDVEVGSVVSPARVLMTLATIGDTRLVLQPDERDLWYVKLGLRARASADAFPEDRFDAEVSYIAPSIEVQRGTVEVRLRVPQPPAYLRPDMTVSVDLLVAKRERTLVAPAEAVHGLATLRPWALAVVQGRAQRRDLKLGIRGDDSVEVLAGLSPGELVVLPDGQAIRPGQRVRSLRKEP